METEDINVNHINQPPKLRWYQVLLIGLTVVLPFAVFLMILVKNYDTHKWQTAMSNLTTKSDVHLFVVPNYRDCMYSRNPSHVVCVGAIGQAAQMKGFASQKILTVISEIETLNKEHKAK